MRTTIPAGPIIHSAAVLVLTVLSASAAVVLSKPAQAAKANSKTSSKGSANDQGPLVQPGVLDNIPRLEEIDWETDFPALLVIRYMPEKRSFLAGWSSWSLSTRFDENGTPIRKPSPWPPFYTKNADRILQGRPKQELTPNETQLFQDWCIKRAQLLPRIVVQTLPFVPSDEERQGGLHILPFGLLPGTPREDQQVDGIGVAQVIHLGLAQNADDYAVAVAPAEAAPFPQGGMTLQTRVRWLDPARREGTLFVPSEPLSLRVVAGDRVVWEHRYPGAENMLPAQAPQPAPAPADQSGAASSADARQSEQASQSASPPVTTANNASSMHGEKYCLNKQGSQMLLVHRNDDKSLTFGLSTWAGSNFAVAGTAKPVAGGWRYEDSMNSTDPTQRCAVTIAVKSGTYQIATVEGARCEDLAGQGAILTDTLSFPPSSRVGDASKPISLENLMYEDCDKK